MSDWYFSTEVLRIFYLWAAVAKRDIKSLSAQELKDRLASWGHKPFRAKQIQAWLFRTPVSEFSAMENIPLSLREQLAGEYLCTSLTEVQHSESVDGTIKFLLRTHDNHNIETVLIPSPERASVCVSTQVGCAMGCTFCRTASMGFTRNLEGGEIIEQVLVANRILQARQGRLITNVIFMGMGEPLHNLNNVHHACTILHDQHFFNLGKRRLTVSTSGIVPGILELIERDTPCCLAVSLNATNDATRSRIMPVNRRWSLEALLAAVDVYLERTGESVTFEFVLIRDITCSAQAARELLRITQRRRCKVNAIVLNDDEILGLRAPDPVDVEEFLSIVRGGQVVTTLRNPRGRDILAACGQLASKQTAKVA